jgi:murein DD-endopeptidase MepM/ murein hydrolase activator NlpD
VPALGSRAAEVRTRGLRLFGLALCLLFLASLSAAWASPAAAKDWTPQIQTTRRAQVYWESVMRAADAEIRDLKKATRKARRKVTKVEARLERSGAKRRTANQAFNAARRDLSETKERVLPTVIEPPPPPDPAIALQTLAISPSLLATTIPGSIVVEPEADLDTTSPTEPVPGEPLAVADERELKRLEREVKKAKRTFKKAKRQARRTSRNTRKAKNQVTTLKAAQRSAVARREGAERNLGAWILAMTRYGRIRATKKSDVRPGVNASFAWPVHGRLSQTYHAGHDGLDIVRYKGAPVRSMAFGVVTYVGWNPWDQHGRAFMVVVTHAGGYETLYGHLLPKRIVRVGEEVKKGQVVGYMGSTGNSSGPHLHLELRRGRTTINPLGFL